VRAEAAALAADEKDRAEAARVLREMETLRAVRSIDASASRRRLIQIPSTAQLHGRSVANGIWITSWIGVARENMALCRVTSA